MKNLLKIKKVALLVLSVCLMLCTILTFSSFSAQATTPTTLSTFVVEKGAQIRTIDPMGIRFSVSISAKEYNTITKDAENVEFGVLIARGKFDNSASAEQILKTNFNSTKKVCNEWDSKNNPTIGTDTYTYNAAIYNIDAANYNKTYAVLGYITVDGTPYYSNITADKENIRSPFQVAVGHKYSLGLEEEADYINGIIKSVMSKNPSFVLDESEYTANVGEDITVGASVDGNAVKPEYVIDDENVAKIVNGKIKAVGVGTTTIYAKIDDGENDYTTEYATITVTQTYKQVSTVEEFLAMKDATANDAYILMNDITMTVNDTTSVPAENSANTVAAWDAQTINNIAYYSIIKKFDGTLDGNGHKVTLINNTAVDSNSVVAGLFYELSSTAVIKNTAFDITVMDNNNSKVKSMIARTVKGTIQDCYIECDLGGASDVNGSGNNNAFVYYGVEGGKLDNVIYNLIGRKFLTLTNLASTPDVNNQIIVGKAAITTRGGYAPFYAGGTSNKERIYVENIALYDSITDMLATNTFGKTYNVTAPITDGIGTNGGSYADRTSKLGIVSDTLKIKESEVTICDKVVIDTYAHIKTAAEFLSMTNGYYILDNDITINANGENGVVEEGSDVAWKTHSYDGTNATTLMPLFSGTLDGKGHKVTIKSNTAITSTMGGVFVGISPEAVIKNTSFDIVFKKPSYTEKWGSVFCTIQKGTIENCFIKTQLVDTTAPSGGGNGSRLTLIYKNNVGTLRNVICDFTTANLSGIAYLDLLLGTVDKLIMIGEYPLNIPRFMDLNTNKAWDSCTALYKTFSDFLDAQNKGYYNNNGVWTDRTEKLAFPSGTNTPWVLSANSITLCGQTIYSVN